MRVQAQAQWEPKFGSQASEYEDAFCPTNAVDDERVGEFTCAIADGATESSYSRIWAKQLAQAACHNRWLDAETLLAQLPHLQKQWASYVRQRLRNRSARPPWYVAEKAQQGAHAALLCLHFCKGGAAWASWRALAVGDCCLVQVRDETIVSLFPFTGAIEFNSRPFLLASQPVNHTQLAQHIHTCSGEWRSGDQFLLMTDALAHWFYRALENNEQPWRAFDDLQGHKDDVLSFQDWMQVLRAEGTIRNDDVTLLRVIVASEDA
jgi:hypothetical protein